MVGGVHGEELVDRRIDVHLETLRWPLSERYSYGVPLDLEPLFEASKEELSLRVERIFRPELTRNQVRTLKNHLYRTVEVLVLEGTVNSVQLAEKILELLIARKGEVDLHAAITVQGIENAERREDAVEVGDLAYEYAMLYLLTGDIAYGEKVRDILLRFAEVVPHWPLYDSSNGSVRAQDVEDPMYFSETFGKGLWGVWHPLDLGYSLSLLRAYDIVQDRLAKEDRQFIGKNLFLHHKQLLDRFSGTLPHGEFPRYSNLVGYHLLPLIRFGWVLERPDFIHEAVRHWEGMQRHSYSPDGFFREVTPAYHRQVSNRLIVDVPLMLKGYSDPKEYCDSVSRKRFDNLDLSREGRHWIKRTQQALHTLAMPDGTCVSLNDDWPKRVQINDEGTLDQPGLLGIAGVAKLGTENMVAFLQFGGMRGHDHRDCLGLVWFAGGREVFSETGYQPLSGSGTTRDWIGGTASHLTVAVDEIQHLENRNSHMVPKVNPRSGFNSSPPEVKWKSGRNVEAAQHAAAKFTNQGRLLLWDTSRKEVQVMEAEQEAAYPQKTSMFRRTVVMVPLGNGEGYLVDIFRVHGGKIHDFFLRGGLDEPYTLTFDVPMQEKKGTVYSHIHLKQSAEIEEGQQIVATAKYPDRFQVISHGGVAGEATARTELLLGEAAAIRRLGNAPFSLLRRTLEGKGNSLDSCYVWVHEAVSGEPKVRGVQVSQVGMEVLVDIQLEGRTDRVFSGTSDESNLQFGDWRFNGRLAYVSEQGQDRMGIVFNGADLSRAGERIASGVPIGEGRILATQRKDAGDDRDALLVEWDSGQSVPDWKLAHIDMGDVIRFSIPVESLEATEDGLWVTLVHTPGFEVHPGETVMTNFPGWRVRGHARIRLE